eukprot:765597-Hanusia_phi.AAC.3
MNLAGVHPWSYGGYSRGLFEVILGWVVYSRGGVMERFDIFPPLGGSEVGSGVRAWRHHLGWVLGVEWTGGQTIKGGGRGRAEDRQGPL